jgi:hypothetical protein
VIGRVGITEREVRRHSPDWLRTVVRGCGEDAAARMRADLHQAIMGVYHGTMGASTEDGNTQMREVLSELSGVASEPDPDDPFSDPTLESFSA